MPMVETLPVTAGVAQWPVWSTTARLVVTDPGALEPARRLVEVELAAVERACSRFRPDTELVDVYLARGRPVTVSRLLADLVRAGLDAARYTGGDVDPTVGAALNGLGYDRDFADLPPPTGAAETSTSARWDSTRLVVVPAAGWRRVRLDGTQLTVPPGIQLDLGATAKAWTADRAAAVVARECGTGVLVSLGGDVATAGPAPDGGWRVLVQDRPDDPAQIVGLPAGAALATSSTVSRQWGRDGGVLHHIVDPRTGWPSPPVWRSASVAAHTCVLANTVSTAVVVRGRNAPGWLRDIGAPARLVDAKGQVRRFGGWPPSDQDCLISTDGKRSSEGSSERCKEPT